MRPYGYYQKITGYLIFMFALVAFLLEAYMAMRVYTFHVAEGFPDPLAHALKLFFVELTVMSLVLLASYPLLPRMLRWFDNLYAR